MAPYRVEIDLKKAQPVTIVASIAGALRTSSGKPAADEQAEFPRILPGLPQQNRLPRSTLAVMIGGCLRQKIGNAFSTAR
jgi:hypothetical protein